MGEQSVHGSVAADWYPDPTGRHEHRYWDGAAWTDHVADAGKATTDPVVKRSISGKEPVPVLVAALGDSDPEIQKAAARALGSRNSPEAVRPLMDCIASDNPSLRIYALESLVEIPAAQADLVQALGDPERPRPDLAYDALREAIQFGRLKQSDRTGPVLRAAFRRSWQSPHSLALLFLLQQAGDAGGIAVARAIDANDRDAVERLIRLW